MSANASGVSNFNSRRLVLARERRGLTKKDLAELVGVTARTMTSYESGQSAPREDHLVTLAQVLGFPPRFFCVDGVEEIALGTASFRSLSKASARLRQRTLAAGAIALEFHRFISERFELPVVDLPNVSGCSPEAAAERVRVVWGMGQKPIKNVVHLLESRGVRVFSLAEDCQTIDAFSLWRDGVPFVFLNSNKTAEHGIFDAAHELGHLVLHRHGAPSGREAEKEADQFAGAFLLPRSAMFAEAPRLATIAKLAAMKTQWRASVAALNYRLHSLGMISEWNYRSTTIELSRRGRANEPGPLRREKSLLLTKVLSALKAEGIGLPELAGALFVPTQELTGLLFGLHAIDGGDQGPGSTDGVKRLLRLVT